MKVLFKYMFKNIWEKKFRTLIVVFSIMISASLFFASNEISDTMVKISTERLRQYVGTSDIVIRPNDQSPNPYFDSADAKGYGETEYVIEALEDIGQYMQEEESSNLNLLGMSASDMETMNPVTLVEPADMNDFTGRQLVISERTAETFDLQKGETLDLRIHGQAYNFEVFAVAKPSGLFREDGGTMFAWIPKAELDDIVEADGDANALFIKLKSKENVDSMIDKLAADYDGYLVSESISDEEIHHQVGAVADSFLLMTVIVSLLSMFIINSSIKVIVYERLPIIGTFRSVGSTKRTTSLMLLTESAMYGVLGGLLGCGLGIGILYIMASVLSAGGPMDESLVQIKPLRLAGAFALAVILPILSSLFPVMKAARTPLKDIILNKIDDDAAAPKRGNLRLVIGLALLAAAFFVPPYLTRDLALPVGILCAIGAIAGTSMITPGVLKGLVKLLEKIIGGLGGSESLLAVKNLKDNKSILNNITLLSIAIATLLMINIVGHGVVVEMTNFYSTSPLYDVMARANKMDAAFVEKAEDLEGVEELLAAYQAKNVVVSGGDGTIGMIEGADPDRFLDYWTFDMSDDSRKLIDEVQEGRNILLTVMLRDKFGVQEGDTLTLEMKEGNFDYKVIGFMNTPRNSANYAIVSEENLKQDMGDPFYGQLFIKTKPGYDPERVVQAFKTDFSQNQPWAMSKAKVAEVDAQNSEQQFTILKGFSLLALMISILSVVNNLVISFIQRKRSLAMFRSVGMSKRQIVKMVILESLLGGMMGSAAGILGGVALISVVPYVLKAIDQRVVIHYTADIFLYVFAAGVLVTLVASLVPASKSSKLNIIESIKME